MNTTEKLISAIMTAVPYSKQITDWDTSGVNSVRFTWRGDRFRVDSQGGVEQVFDGLLGANNISILLEKLIKNDL